MTRFKFRPLIVRLGSNTKIDGNTHVIITNIIVAFIKT